MARWPRIAPVDCSPRMTLSGNPIGSTPKNDAPMTSPVSTTSTTAIHAQNTATTNFENTRRPRPMGRISM